MTRFPRARTGRLPRACRRHGKSPTRSPGAPAETPAIRASTARRPALRRPTAPTCGSGNRRLGGGDASGEGGVRGSVGETQDQPASRSCRGTKMKRSPRSRTRSMARGSSPTTSSPGSRAGRSTPTARATPSKLSQPMLDLAARAEAMTLDDYRRDISGAREAARCLSSAGGGIRRLPDLGGAGRGAGRPRLDGRPGVRDSGLDAWRSGDLASRPSRTAAFRSGFSCSGSPTRTRRCFRPPAACWLCCSRAEPAPGDQAVIFHKPQAFERSHVVISALGRALGQLDLDPRRVLVRDDL